MKTIPANTPFQTNSDKISVRVMTVPAQLSFSTDGEEFTNWSDVINDSNVVVANIPVGCYLRFDCDVKITEK